MKVEITTHTASGHVSKVTLSDNWTYDRLAGLEEDIRSRRNISIEDGPSTYFFCFSSPHLILVTTTPIDP